MVDYQHDGRIRTPGASKRRLEANFLVDGSLPTWLSKVGGADLSLIHQDVASGMGELQLEAANVNGGLQGPEVDMSQFEEVAFGATVRHNFSTDENVVGFSWTSSSGPLDGSSADSFKAWYQNNKFNLQFNVDSGGVSQVDTSTAGPKLESGNQFSFQVRARPGDERVTLASQLPDGVFYDEPNQGFDPSKTYYPTLQIDSSLDANTASVWVSDFWIEFVTK